MRLGVLTSLALAVLGCGADEDRCSSDALTCRGTKLLACDTSANKWVFLRDCTLITLPDGGQAQGTCLDCLCGLPCGGVTQSRCVLLSSPCPVP